MALRMGGASRPMGVRSCIIRNDSDQDVYINLVYKQFEDEAESNIAHQHDINLSPGEAYQAVARQVVMGSAKLSADIEVIEITPANNETMKLEQPFDGVEKIERDWLFVIDNEGIHSVGRNSESGQ
ncbi:unnamed protein product [Rotaria sordida]|uniref:Uncharacterized protein n=1 Tax=Rotaria sordida TaxID=392033 RepID=A0A815BBR6_9BILA|nr:unnamed protein product [Rotaria sordida]CAF1546825.1 unnamed protein product [Rotaria sordida]